MKQLIHSCSNDIVLGIKYMFMKISLILLVLLADFSSISDQLP